jgi:integrase
VTINGRDRYLGKYGSKASRAEYARLIGEWESSDSRASPDRDELDLTITELVARYWRFAQGYYVKDGKPTETLYGIKAALRYLRRSYGHTRASDFGPLRLKAVRSQMVEAGLSRSYINGNVRRIRACFRWAASEELLPASVCEGLAAVDGLKKGRSQARETEPVEPVADEVVDATLPYVSPVVADMIRFHRLVGCRPNEVCTIRPCDVDRSEEVWAYRPRTHKTQHHDRDRIIFIGPKAQQVLRPYLLRDHLSCCFSPAESCRQQTTRMGTNSKRPRPCPRHNRSVRKSQRAPGDHYTRSSYNRAIRRAVDRANRERDEKDKLPYWHPNQLRHAVATKVRGQFGLEGSQVVLGHSNADVTQVYAERDFGLARDIMKKIG